MADLLSAGYDVYRAISASCPCDLAIVKHGQLIRVEVTTSYLQPNGKIQSAKKRESPDYDCVAHFLRKTKEVIYEPALGKYFDKR